MREAEALRVVSSAKMSTVVSGGIVSARSLMKIRKSSGARTDSCDTPCERDWEEEYISAITVRCFLSLRYDHI